MSSTLMNADAVPNLPWEERPQGHRELAWCYSGNPVIPRDLIPNSNSIFNSAVVPFSDAFAGVFRCDDRHRAMQLHRGFSSDAIHWDIENERIHWKCDAPEVGRWGYGYDPRVVWLEDRYYAIWCNAYRGWPTVGVGYTHDF